jgi:hypothetical protein
MVAFIFPPLIFYLLNKKNVSLAVLTTAALICSHNVIALLFLPVIVGFLVVKKVNFITCILYLGLSAGAAAWFWFPALYDLQFTKAGQIAVSNFRDYWLTANNFWAVLGPIVPMIIIISLIRINEKKFTFLFLITVGSLFFALPVSEIFWKILPLPKLVQFPWRYLAVTIFGASILTGYLLRVANKYLLAAFILVVVLLSWPKIERQYHPESYYVTNDDTTTVQNEYMPKWVTQAISHKAEVKSQKLDEKYAEINTVYFPGVKVFAGERELEVKPSDNGLLLVDSRLDNLHISFGETPLRLAADLASILSVILLIFL